ncbi:MAG: chromate efflux transporter [Saprospiraceae bacterium]|nr:chromate efflux transporter [Saprospiraceae bacterium]
MEVNEAIIHQTKAQIFRRFLKFGLLAWGGPVAQIAMIKKELVEEEKWITPEKFNRVLAVYQALPGPEAHELCVYFGMLAGGRWGGFLAGLGFMLPGFVLILLLTAFYITFGIKSPLVLAVFVGFQIAVIALIIRAVHRIGEHILTNYRLWIIAIVSGIAFFLGAHFLIILVTAGISYIFWMRKNVIVTTLLGFALLLYSILSFSPETLQPIINTEATASGFHQGTPLQIFLSGLKGGLLTFGGAYTLIPIMQQDAVITNAWMTHQQFLDGIALSGLLPAPLVIFATFVGYFGGGWLGAILITIGIFLPAFSFTLIGYHIMERIIAKPSLHNFLDGISAGVIGLIAVTALQLFRATINDWLSLLICVLSLFILYRFKSKFVIIFVIIGAGMLSLLWHRLFL